MCFEKIVFGASFLNSGHILTYLQYNGPCKMVDILKDRCTQPINRRSCTKRIGKITVKTTDERAFTRVPFKFKTVTGLQP